MILSCVHCDAIKRYLVHTGYRQMQSSGQLSHLMSKYLPSSEDYGVEEEEDAKETLNLLQTGLAFVLWGVICLLGILMCTFEVAIEGRCGPA